MSGKYIVSVPNISIRLLQQQYIRATKTMQDYCSNLFYGMRLAVLANKSQNEYDL